MWICFHLFSKWIVSGLLGVNGSHVLRLVEKVCKKERGLKSKRHRMVERNVMALIRKQDYAINKNVQVQ